jgi:hypothetical protein
MPILARGGHHNASSLRWTPWRCQRAPRLRGRRRERVKPPRRCHGRRPALRPGGPASLVLGLDPSAGRAEPAPRGRQTRCARCPTRSLPRQASGLVAGIDAARTLLDGAGRELLARESGSLGLLVVGAGIRTAVCCPARFSALTALVRSVKSPFRRLADAGLLGDFLARQSLGGGRLRLH